MTRSADAVIFDLDGTLLDTLEDLADSGNAVLARLSLPQHPAEAYRNFVGLGLRVLCLRMLPEDRRHAADVECALGLLGEEYAARWKNKTRPYPGVPELLKGLRDRGLPICVLSNKPQPFTELTTAEFLQDAGFARIRGAREGKPKKPDPSGALEMAAELGLAPARIVFVGDSATDMQTARAAGMYPVGALWGFRDAEELRGGGAARLIERPGELLDILEDDRPGDA